jgi:alpha-mannosidase
VRVPAVRPTTITTEVTLVAGEPLVRFATSFDNQVTDHRLRALFHAPFSAERLDVDHGLAVAARPLDPSVLGAGTERPAPTGQHHLFVDVTDGQRGVALMGHGLGEHEVVREGDGAETRLALTLLRAVGWLSRGDLSVIDHAAGPMVPTPGAQESGLHRFEYALYLHPGNWEEGDVLSHARRFAAPAIAVVPKGKSQAPGARPLCELAPASVVLSAAHPALDGNGVVARVLNAAPRPVDAVLKPAMAVREALAVDPLERPLDVAGGPVMRDGAVVMRLGPWQLATILLR